MWQYVGTLEQSEIAYVNVNISACMFEAEYQTHTTLRCWNWHPTKLERKCSLQGDRFSCGRSRADGHAVLEFGGKSTKEAAAYVPELCKRWAIALSEAAVADTTTGDVLADASLHARGRVRRHELRGKDEDTAREVRDKEDRECRAGARNTADLITMWPRLWKAMGQVCLISSTP